MLFLGIIRTIQLKSLRCMYQAQIHSIVKAKMGASQAAQNYLKVGTGTDFQAESLIAKKLEMREAKLNELEKQLDIKKGQLETKLQMINEELNSLKDEVSSAIKESFSYRMAG